jgi:hypothetical protein
MGRNRGRQALTPEFIHQVVHETITAMAARHPTVPADVLADTVGAAAADLTCTMLAPDQFAASLRRRAHGRLAAMTGNPIPIARSAHPTELTSPTHSGSPG